MEIKSERPETILRELELNLLNISNFFLSSSKQSYMFVCWLYSQVKTDFMRNLPNFFEM